MRVSQKFINVALLCISALTTAEIAPAQSNSTSNPLLVQMNVPVEFSKVTAANVSDYGKQIMQSINKDIEAIKAQKTISFASVFEAFDVSYNKLNTASNTCYMLYWVSPDSMIRANGLSSYQQLDSQSTAIFSDKDLFSKMLSFKSTAAYKELTGHRKFLVDDLIDGFERSGVNLSAEKLTQYKKLSKEIGELTSSYSVNMNSANDVLKLDEAGTKGLTEDFKNKYRTTAGNYEIPIINATNEPVMNNAEIEATRKAFYFKFTGRAATQNLPILDSLISKRYALAKLMNYPSYAAYSLGSKMAKNPKTVWSFVYDLIERSKDKAKLDLAEFERNKKADFANEKDVHLNTWDIDFYKSKKLKSEFNVNYEELRPYLPMDQCLKGMFDIYQKLLGLEFKKVSNPSVWHPEVEMYEVYETGKLKGRFYLDLFPRPNKESWFYGVNLISGKYGKGGNEIPVSMLLGNFTRPTPTSPSLLSPRELKTLFHEFGHIMNMMSYEGEFSMQSSSKADFTESMSQLFENWLWDYSILSSFAKHYKTGEVLPLATFENMLKAKNVASGYASIRSLRMCLYDMNVYDKYNPQAPVSTDKLWQQIDKELGVMDFYVEGTHPQANWIHINSHPVYYYGYLWSEVYAQDMFTQFKKNGLTDTKTGVRYRKLILANGTQRDIVEAVEEFIGRPSDNKAYIKSLGLE